MNSLYDLTKNPNMDIHKFRKIWKDVRNDPSLKNTLDVNALLEKDRGSYLHSKTDDHRLVGFSRNVGESKVADATEIHRSLGTKTETPAIVESKVSRKPSIHPTVLPSLPHDRQSDFVKMNMENLAVLRGLSPPLTKPILYDIHNKLTEFFHIEELHELRMGRYTRWIREDDHETLKSGGILVDIKFAGKGTLLSILPLRAKHPFYLKFDGAEIFQKLTDEEKLLAAAAVAMKPTPVQAWSALPAIR
jgi:hypothetical protein